MVKLFHVLFDLCYLIFYKYSKISYCKYGNVRFRLLGHSGSTKQLICSQIQYDAQRLSPLCIEDEHVAMFVLGYQNPKLWQCLK